MMTLIITLVILFQIYIILKMCWSVSFIYNFYQELKDKEIWNRMNLKKEDYYIVDFYGDIIFLK